MTESPKKIAIVSHAHPSVSSGGAEISAYALFRGLLDRGHDAIFVATCRDDEVARLSLELPDREFIVPFVHEQHDWFYHLSPARVQDGVLDVLKAFAPDVVNFHHFIFIGIQTVRAASLLWPGRVFLTLHEFLGICQSDGQMVTRPHRRLCVKGAPETCIRCWPEYDAFQFGSRHGGLRETLAGVAGLISPSEFLKQRFVDWGIDETHISVIENGLAKPLARSEAKAPVAGDHWTFGYFGQINPYKGVEVLLGAAEHALAKSGEAMPWTIRVHGPLVGQSDAFTERLNKLTLAGAVQYPGPYLNERVGELMAAVDYVVVPSLWWENSPVVIQEAFAVGRPVIVSGIGGMAEKVRDHHTGFHFTPGEAADLYRVMNKAADQTLHTTLVGNLPLALSADEMARHYDEAFARTQAARPAVAA